MKNIYLLLSVLLTTQAFALSEIDQRLQGYIETFNLKPLEAPSAFDKKLFVLGREFFFEKKLSGNKNISCADCHHPRTMTTDKIPFSLGEGAKGIEITSGGRQQHQGKIIPRNSPALFNLHNVPVLFWDGRISQNMSTGEFNSPGKIPTRFVPILKNALAAQALFPMLSHEEMRGEVGSNEIANAKTDEDAWDLLFERIIKDENYNRVLQELFPAQELNLAHVARAIAYFQEQAFFAADTNYDRYLKGDLRAMTEIQKIGMDIFFSKGKCGECHRGEHLTDFSFHNVGTPQIGPGRINGDDFGRFEQDPKDENLYAFRVPGLRNVSVTAPYMHDGAFKTLAQVIEHYDDIATSLNEYSFVNNYKNYFEKLGEARVETNELKLSHLSNKLSRNLNFEESEEKALAEFLRGALTERRFLEAEIDDSYETFMRIQLRPEGYEKILKTLPANAKAQRTNYYYFDVLTSEGYRLRELETPIKIFFTQNENGVQLNYRKQLFKTSGAVNGVIAGATFENNEILKLPLEAGESLIQFNNDFFSRLYTYNNDDVAEEIPLAELTIMKNDVTKMNNVWHSLDFSKVEVISNELNIPKEKLFFTPTSTNLKEEHNWTMLIGGFSVEAVLQMSEVRTATGGLTNSWAIELKLNKISKKDLSGVVESWLKGLVEGGVTDVDAQGVAPSPSKLTEKVLLEILK
jgi:cytochrome c peroxidase